MIRVILLDTGPLGLVTQRPGLPAADACRDWVADCEAGGVRVVVPEIADYEVRRELLRANKVAGLSRLDAFNAAEIDRYVPITTHVMRVAAELRAQSKRAGLPTADPKELDVDVVVAAQALALGLALSEIVVATVNVGHISRFVPADTWQNIHP